VIALFCNAKVRQIMFCNTTMFYSLFRTYSAAQAREMAASTLAFAHERSNSFGSQTSMNSRSSQDTIQGMFSGTVSLYHPY
jgi:hypothetical protein